MTLFDDVFSMPWAKPTGEQQQFTQELLWKQLTANSTAQCLKSCLEKLKQAEATEQSQTHFRAQAFTWLLLRPVLASPAI